MPTHPRYRGSTLEEGLRRSNGSSERSSTPRKWQSCPHALLIVILFIVIRGSVPSLEPPSPRARAPTAIGDELASLRGLGRRADSDRFARERPRFGARGRALTRSRGRRRI